MNKNGFTLVEIMVAVSILCVILAITLPGLFRMRQDANNAKVQAELSSLYKAFSMHYLYKDRFLRELSELSDYITIHNIENKYELNPNLQ